MRDSAEFFPIDPAAEPSLLGEIKDLLARSGLECEDGIDVFVVSRSEGRIIACGGIKKNIIKCCAVAPEYRGQFLGRALLNEIIHLGYEMKRGHLFLYTSPHNVGFFQGCGFYPLVEVPDYVTMLENTPIGISSYCAALNAQKREGYRIGAIVMDADIFGPFHHQLVRRVADDCDWLHVFVSTDDPALDADRLGPARDVVRGIEHLTLHYDPLYSVSPTTFSSYFFKDKSVVAHCRTALDVLLFRNYIAPTLGINRRYVLPEPFCPLNREDEEELQYWLEEMPTDAPAVALLEETDGLAAPVRASGHLERRRMIDVIRAQVENNAADARVLNANIEV